MGRRYPEAYATVKKKEEFTATEIARWTQEVDLKASTPSPSRELRISIDNDRAHFLFHVKAVVHAQCDHVRIYLVQVDMWVSCQEQE